MNQTPDPHRRPPTGRPPEQRPRYPQNNQGAPHRTGSDPSGQRPTPTPVQNVRAERRAKQRTTLLAIFVVIALTLCLVIGLIFSELKTSVDDLNDKNGNKTSENTSSTTSASESNTTTTTANAMEMTVVQKNRTDMGTGDLILVDADHAYTFPSSTTHLISLYGNIPYAEGTTTRLYQLRKTYSLERTTHEALNKMMQDFYTQFGSGEIIVNWAYRSLSDQQSQYDEYVKDYPGYTDSQIKELLRGVVDTPGYSEHHLGTCVDLKISSEAGNKALESNSAYFSWLTENCWKYGFIFRSPANGSNSPSDSYNPYYFRYIGLPHAYYIHQNGICLEKYLDILRTSTSPTGEHLEISPDGGTTYEVYYVSASGNITDVKVPKNYPYTISGDNDSGFIVTVTK